MRSASAARHVMIGLAAIVPTFLCATAHAQKKPAKVSDTLEILGVVSDDAEEQADSLTEALRSQAKTLPGLTVGDAIQTLDVMTTANKCPQSPDPTCQVEIGKQLKTTQYLWGVMRKSGASTVTIELHHYVKDKPDHFVAVTYSSNLRDQNDEALRKVAKRLLVELLHVKTGFVHAAGQGAMATCSITLDGKPAGDLRDGTLLIETTPGEHTVATAGNCPKFQQAATVPNSGEVLVTLIDPGKPTVAPPPSNGEQPYFNAQRIVGASLMGAGLAAGVVSIIFTVKYFGDEKRGNDAFAGTEGQAGERANGTFTDAIAAATVNKNGKSTIDDGVLCEQPNNPPNTCAAYRSAKQSSTIAITTGIVGGALLAGGAVLFFTAGKKADSSKAALPGNLRLQPAVGQTNGLWLSGSF